MTDNTIKRIEAEARRYAEMYPQSSDGRNTFVMFADWVAGLATAAQGARCTWALHKQPADCVTDHAYSIWFHSDDEQHSAPVILANTIPGDEDKLQLLVNLANKASELTEGNRACREPGFVKPDNDRQVFFYEQDFYVLSNFSAFSLNWQGWRFDTSEAAYHWEKFAHMNEAGIVGGHECHPCYVIRRAPSAHAAFKIAEANKTARRADWDDVKVGIMREILRAKANQHEYVRRKLLATGDRELIEDSWRDDFWGWGTNRTGKNMLGKLWMEIRAELRSAPTSLPSTDRKTP